MRLVDNGQKVPVREIVNQCIWSLPRLKEVDMSRVVLDALAGSELEHHLNIVVGSLLKPLCLEQLAVGLEPVEPLVKLLSDIGRRPYHVVPVRYIMRRRENADVLPYACHISAYRVDLLDRLNLIAPEFNSYCRLAACRIYIDNISPGPEGAAMEIYVVSLILNICKRPEQSISLNLLPRPQTDKLIAVGIR